MTKSKLSRLAVIGIAAWAIVVVIYLFYADLANALYILVWAVCGGALIALSTIGLGWALNLER